MTQLYIVDGRQYPADRLPAGVKVEDVQTLEDWFAENRVPQHKAVTAPEPPAKRSKAK